MVAGPVTIERSRSYHREWLIKFAGADHRDALDPWRGLFLAVPADQLAPPTGDEVYLHELEGFAVRLEDGTAVGLVSAVYELPGGVTLEVQGPKREFLLPFKREFVREVDRAGRRLVVTPPAGAVARLAAARLSRGSYDAPALFALEPHYVRPSEAEIKFPAVHVHVRDLDSHEIA